MKIKRKKIVHTFFLVLWAVYSISYYLCKQSEFAFMYDLGKLFQFISYAVSVGLLAVVLMQNKFKIHYILLIIVMGGFFALSILYLKDAYLLVLLCFILAGYQVNLTELVRFDLVIRICTIVFLVSLSLLGVIDNYSAVINGVYKQAFGFGHPNVLTAMVFISMVEWIYLRFYKLKWYDIVGIVLCSVIISNISAGRSSIYAFALILIITVILKKWPKILDSKLVKYTCSLLATLLAVLSFVLVKLYNSGNAMALALNSILSKRLYGASALLNAYGVSIIGQKVSTYGTRTAAESTAEYFSVDMSYIYIPIGYGIVMLIFFCVGYYFYTKKVIESKNIPLLIAILFFVILGFMESYLYRISFNFTLVAMLSSIGSARTRKGQRIKIRR